MTPLRKAAVALVATAATLLPVSPTASASPSPVLARETFDRLPLGPVTVSSRRVEGCTA
ncbi:hypothetical protein ACIPIU_21195 [Streptomyces massasporeus]|uniref:hypothetical protein n=1 Tax=Streptomyces massasporeus TaxID=67324 RepID=UPI00380CEEAE